MASQPTIDDKKKSDADFKPLQPETSSQPTQQHLECMEFRRKAIHTCPRVSFLIDAIKSLGCKIDNPEKFISCIKFDGTKGGGFQTQGGEEPHIYLAENAGFNADQVNMFPLIN
jgi:hypothetical protein